MKIQDYEKFEQILKSQKTEEEYANSYRGDCIVSFQVYGFSNAQIKKFWAKYKRQNKNHGYRFRVESACVVKW